MGRPEEAEPEACRGRLLAQLAGTVAASLMVASNCFAIGWGIVANWQLQQPGGSLPLDRDQRTWVISILYLGAGIGCLMGGRLAARFGPRGTMLLSLPAIALANAVIFLAPSFEILMAGRFVSGWSTGLPYAVYMLYISGISSPTYRGMFGIIADIINISVIMLVVGVGGLLNWRWLAVFCAAANIVPCAALLALVPEDPVFLMTNGRLSEAKRAATFFDIELEVADASALEPEEGGALATLKTLATRKNLVPFAIILTMFLFSTFSGYMAILSYSLEFFRQAGFQLDANVCTVLFCGIRALAAFCTSQVIDRVGRRVLLIASCVGVAVCYGAMVCCYQIPALQAAPALPIVLLLAAGFIFSSGLGPITFCLVGEMFPLRIRQLGASVVPTFYMLFSLMGTVVFPATLAAFGPSGLFLFHAVIMLLAAGFVFFFLPETRGLSLAAIETLFVAAAIPARVAAPQMPPLSVAVHVEAGPSRGNSSLGEKDACDVGTFGKTARGAG